MSDSKQPLAGASSSAPTGSACQHCIECANWQKHHTTGLGWCHLFAKLTASDHGAFCTAWVSQYASADDYMLPNAQAQPRREGGGNE